MNTETLKVFAKVRGLSQSEISKRVGISRQAVSAWFHKERPGKGNINLYAKHLEKLARVLNTSIEDLSKPLPVISNPMEKKMWETQLLWDSLYPNLESFVAGLLAGHLPALARLVQSSGLFQADKIIGKQVWSKFPQYKALIHPAYRKSLEIIWQTQTNPI